MKPVVIIGSGLGGYSFVREFRKLDKETPLLVITADDGSAYAKPVLSNALSKGQTADTIPTASASNMQDQFAIQVISSTVVSMIDLADHQLHYDGETLEYDNLVLAIGADPIHIPVEGDAAESVLSINNLLDYRIFCETIKDKQHVTIMGGGLIGCEFANDLSDNGYQAEVVDPASGPLGSLLPTEVADYVKQKLSAINIVWHFGKTVSSINQSNDRYKLTLSNGHVIHTDLLLSAVGLRCRTKLAQDSGLEVNRGIVVNAMLETSDKHVFALGDCAEVAGLVLPFVMPLMHCARALAKTLCGSPTRVSYPAMPVVVKTPACPLVVSPPDRNAKGQWKIEPCDNGDDGIKGLFYVADKLLGFALAGSAVAEKQVLTRQLPAVLVAE